MRMILNHDRRNRSNSFSRFARQHLRCLSNPPCQIQQQTKESFLDLWTLSVQITLNNYEYLFLSSSIIPKVQDIQIIREYLTFSKLKSPLEAALTCLASTLTNANNQLEKIKTNYHLSEIDYSLISPQRQVNRTQKMPKLMSYPQKQLINL